MKPMEYGNMVEEIERSRRKIKRLIKAGDAMTELISGDSMEWEQDLINAWEKAKKS